jgi:hypothetical protein
MALKPDGKTWAIREQIIEDRVTDLTFQFEVMPDGEMRFRIFGKSLPFGNREIIFDEDGTEAGSGTATAGLCRPAWIQQMDF